MPVTHSEPGGRVVLARTRGGSARRCPCCDKVEVVFGNAVFSLSREALSTLHRHLSAVGDTRPGTAAAAARLKVGLPGFVLLLDRDEAAELTCLLGVALRCL